MARDESKPIHIEYERKGETIRFRLQNVDKHELRAYITGLWGCLEPRERLDMIRELGHYHEHGPEHRPIVGQAIAAAYEKARRMGEPSL